MKSCILSVAILFCACGKTVQYKGVVCARNMAPISNAKVELFYARGGKSQVAGSYTATTGADGRFSFEVRDQKRLSYLEIDASHADSGYAETYALSKTQDITLILHK